MASIFSQASWNSLNTFLRNSWHDQVETGKFYILVMCHYRTLNHASHLWFLIFFLKNSHPSPLTHIQTHRMSSPFLPLWIRNLLEWHENCYWEEFVEKTCCYFKFLLQAVYLLCVLVLVSLIKKAMNKL